MCKKINSKVKNSCVTRGLHHLGLTVSHVEKTAGFLEIELGFNRVGGSPNYPSIFLTDGVVMLTLWQAKGENIKAFNRNENIGLHHFALKVASVNVLYDLYKKLEKRRDVSIEFAPEPLGEAPLQHMMCIIPGGIRMELLAFSS